MSHLNKPWHREHRMFRNPTPRQRVEWPLEHVRKGRCHPMPDGVKSLIRSLGLEDPPAGTEGERE